MIPFHHYFFTCTQTSLHNEFITKFRSQLNEPFLCRRISAHHINICSAFLDSHCFMRYNDGSFTYIQEQLYLRKLSRKQYLFRVRHLRSYRKSTGLRIYLRFGKIHISFIRVYRIIR